MKLLDLVWELIDNALFIAHLLAVVLVVVVMIVVPIWLRLIHEELKAIRGGQMPCQCSPCECDDRPGPVLPRVLPRLRRLGEEAPE